MMKLKKLKLNNPGAVMPHFGANAFGDYDYDDYIYDGGYLPEVVVFPPGHQFFNVDDTIARLNAHAHATSQGACGRYVRLALEAGGFERTEVFVSAYRWAGYLSSRGVPTVAFINNCSFQPQMGDIAVFGAIQGHVHGHIQIWNGQQWVSDFRQNDFWPGSSYHNAFNNGTGVVTIFRQ